MIKKTVTGEEPVSVVQAKEHLRVDYDSHDTYIGELIMAARGAIEKYLGVSIVESEVEVDISPWPPHRLPYGPVKEISSYKVDGTEATPPSDEVIKTGDRIEATYTTGYTDVPPEIKHAIKVLVKKWYDSEEISTAVPHEIKMMIEPHNRNLFI